MDTQENKRVHFIAIGGAVMHNLALALHQKGYTVTGSDDEIFEPSRTRLAAFGLLPSKMGWDPEKITAGIGTIILGMHARNDNPELIRARELGITIMSFPEYLFEQTKNKKRIVIAGSHGKTTTTAMIMHVLKFLGISFDYMVGSKIDGFETMVGLSDDSRLAVFEGDEYLTSALDPRPKFHLYNPDVAILNGIAWDHMNVFPTFENYLEQFRVFVNKITPGGKLIYFEDDPEVKKIAGKSGENILKIPYKTHSFIQDAHGFYAEYQGNRFPLKIFGQHNMQNLSAAKEACLSAGISPQNFYRAIQSFSGTSKRLQKLAGNKKGDVWLDFAHSPSKVKATVDAIASRFPGRDIIACLELHTYSSLSASFLPLYKNTLSGATYKFVYFNPHAVMLKKLPPVSAGEILNAFGDRDIRVFDNSGEMFSFISKQIYNNPVFLFMSSGDFDGKNMAEISENLIK